VFKDFKKFISRGNILDLAVAVVIGGAFGKIVTSLVSDIIMPLISIVTGKIKFENLFISLDGQSYGTIEAAQAAGASTINYGLFIIAVIDFFIIALSIFIVIRQMAKIQKKLEKTSEPAAAPAVKECDFCKSSIHKDASRCPNCTSELKIKTEAEKKEA